MLYVPIRFSDGFARGAEDAIIDRYESRVRRRTRSISRRQREPETPCVNSVRKYVSCLAKVDETRALARGVFPNVDNKPYLIYLERAEVLAGDGKCRTFHPLARDSNQAGWLCGRVIGTPKIIITILIYLPTQASGHHHTTSLRAADAV